MESKISGCRFCLQGNYTIKEKQNNIFHFPQRIVQYLYFSKNAQRIFMQKELKNLLVEIYTSNFNSNISL